MKLTYTIGASGTYALIETPTRSMSVKVNDLSKAELHRVAEEMLRKAQRMLARAQVIEEAANL